MICALKLMESPYMTNNYYLIRAISIKTKEEAFIGTSPESKLAQTYFRKGFCKVKKIEYKDIENELKLRTKLPYIWGRSR